MQPITNVVQLRKLLAERFPGTRIWSQQSLPRTTACWPTGLPQIDNLLAELTGQNPAAGGLPKSAISELTCAAPSCGSGLVMLALLRRAQAINQWIALVDGTDSFDPAGLGEEAFTRLLWVRCRDAAQAMKAADLLLRDGNLQMVLLDLRMNDALQLRRIPSSSWHRFQRLVEATSTALLVITPHALVSSARIRLKVTSRFGVDALNELQSDLLRKIQIELDHAQSLSSGNQLVAQAG